MPPLPEQLNKVLFWDIDPENMDEIFLGRLIIERVMNYGNIEEIKLIMSYYGAKVIRNTVCNLNYIDPKTLNFISLLLHIPKSKFKCYIRKQLIDQPWSY